MQLWNLQANLSSESPCGVAEIWDEAQKCPKVKTFQEVTMEDLTFAS